MPMFPPVAAPMGFGPSVLFADGGHQSAVGCGNGPSSFAAAIATAAGGGGCALAGTLFPGRRAEPLLEKVPVLIANADAAAGAGFCSAPGGALLGRRGRPLANSLSAFKSDSGSDNPSDKLSDIASDTASDWVPGRPSDSGRSGSNCGVSSIIPETVLLALLACCACCCSAPVARGGCADVSGSRSTAGGWMSPGWCLPHAAAWRRRRTLGTGWKQLHRPDHRKEAFPAPPIHFLSYVGCMAAQPMWRHVQGLLPELQEAGMTA